VGRREAPAVVNAAHAVNRFVDNVCVDCWHHFFHAQENRAKTDIRLERFNKSKIP
jgi:hypothetical protein